MIISSLEYHELGASESRLGLVERPFSVMLVLGMIAENAAQLLIFHLPGQASKSPSAFFLIGTFFVMMTIAASEG